MHTDMQGSIKAVWRSGCRVRRRGWLSHVLAAHPAVGEGRQVLGIGHDRGEDGRQRVVDRAEDLDARYTFSAVVNTGRTRSNTAADLGSTQSGRRSAGGEHFNIACGRTCSTPHLRCGQHAGRSALGHEDSAGVQLLLHDGLVELLGVQLRAATPGTQTSRTWCGWRSGSRTIHCRSASAAEAVMLQGSTVCCAMPARVDAPYPCTVLLST